MIPTKKIHYFKSGTALMALVVLASSFGASTAEGATKRKRAKMTIDTARKQVVQDLEAFRKTGDTAHLREAANSIDQVEVQIALSLEERRMARTAKLGLWLTLLDTIDAAKDPKFNPEDVPAARVTLPPGTAMKPGFPIETPEGIANPEDRRKYDEAIKANAEKTNRYRFQKELRQMDAELTDRADASITSDNSKSLQSVKEMNDAIAAHLRRPDRVAHLRSLVTP